MKTVLCYGDSNTYGYNPHDGGRYPKEIRWTTILGNLLGKEYDVIPEGLNGRTTAYNRDGENVKNGLDHYRAIYGSHRPVDIVVFMLGTNDCCEDTNKSVQQIVDGMNNLILTAKDSAMQKQDYIPKIILAIPALIKDKFETSPLADTLSIDSVRKSKEIIEPYKKLAEKQECILVDASVLEVSDIDSMHLTEESHKRLAYMLYEIIKNI